MVPHYIMKQGFLLSLLLLLVIGGEKTVAFSPNLNSCPPTLSIASSPICIGRPVRCFSASSSSLDIHDTESSSAWEDDAYDEDDEWEEEKVDEDDGMEEADNDTAEDSNPQIRMEYNQWVRAVDQAATALQKKATSLQKELEKANQVEALESRAQLLTSYLYMFQNDALVKSVRVPDWETGAEIELTLNPDYSSASEEANDLFDKVRKLKRGSSVVSELLEETNQAIDILREAKQDLSAAAPDGDSSSITIKINEDLFRLVQDRLLRTTQTTQFQPPTLDDENDNSDSNSNHRKQQLQRQSRKTKKGSANLGTPASNIRKLTTPAGTTLLVGRNRRGNEHLSFVVAKKDDLWMHARGCPGAHVLVRGGGAATAGTTPECLQWAANIAAFYSDARSEAKTEIMTVHPKHLLKPRGAPLGAVKVRQEHGVLLGYPEQVPAELVQARADSGQASEYRRTDKSKLRKRNKQQQLAAAAKRKKRRRKESSSS